MLSCLRDRSIFVLFLTLRLSSVFIVQTFFVPDEFWQSLEVAHKLTFGYGYLTWEWEKKIRSSVYPVIFSIFYSVIPDVAFLLIYLPRILQAILSTAGDFFTYKLALKLFGPHCSFWTVFNICSSWFLFYCSSRTLTNMAEASLTACGLYLYPWKKEISKKLQTNYLWFAGASVLIRPTGAVLWIMLYIQHIWKETNLYSLFKDTLVKGLIILSVSLACDRYFYGQWVVTLYNFFLFNWSKDIGAFYGSHNIFWYITSGLPVVLLSLIVPFIMGLTIPKLRSLYILVFWFVFIFSIPSHKEFRFLLPVLPLCIIISSAVMTEISYGEVKLFGRKMTKLFCSYFVFFSLSTNLFLGIYMGVFHQRGTIDAVLQLSKLVKGDSKVLFLMPCHSTPYYSHIHHNISMKFLTCEPDFGDSENYIEEAEEFYQHPSKWLSLKYDAKSLNSLPTHVVLFDSLYPQVSSFLEKYHLCYQTFYSHAPDERRGNYVHIYCKN